MKLSDIKTNTQKWETKDEPQKNGSYKIRKIIVIIMEYTYMKEQTRKTQAQINEEEIGSYLKKNSE